MSKKSIPCYIPNGGEHFIVNIPLGQFTRVRLKNFCKELLDNLQTFETMFVAEATERNRKLLESLVQILDIDFKPLSNRGKAEVLTTAAEENLKPTQRSVSKERVVNLVDLSVKFGLIILLFAFVFHLNYLECH